MTPSSTILTCANADALVRMVSPCATSRLFGLRAPRRRQKLPLPHRPRTENDLPQRLRQAAGYRTSRNKMQPDDVCCFHMHFQDKPFRPLSKLPFDADTVLVLFECITRDSRYVPDQHELRFHNPIFSGPPIHAKHHDAHIVPSIHHGRASGVGLAVIALACHPHRSHVGIFSKRILRVKRQNIGVAADIGRGAAVDKGTLARSA